MSENAHKISSSYSHQSEGQNIGPRLEFMQLDEASLSHIRSLKSIA